MLLLLYPVTYLILLGSIHGAITHYRLPPPHSPAHVPWPKPQDEPGVRQKDAPTLLFLGSFRVYSNTRRASVGALLLPLIGEMQNTESQDKLMSGRPDAREKEKKNEARAGSISALFGPGKHATLLET